MCFDPTDFTHIFISHTHFVIAMRFLSAIHRLNVYHLAFNLQFIMVHCPRGVRIVTLGVAAKAKPLEEDMTTGEITIGGNNVKTVMKKETVLKKPSRTLKAK